MLKLSSQTLNIINQYKTTHRINSKRVHLGIFVEPYLSYVLDGSKIWESRFSYNRCSPYQTADTNDVLLIKKQTGPILGICRISKVFFLNSQESSFSVLKKTYSELLRIDDASFWEERINASYATLMMLETVWKIDPIKFQKKDRRGWVVFDL